MSNYIKSDGTIIDTATMNDKYIERALSKAIAEGNENNKLALEEEILVRSANNGN